MGAEPHLGFSHDPLCTPGHQPARVLKRFGSWVGTNGILLIVRHHHGTRHQHDHPEEATVSLDAIAELFQAQDRKSTRLNSSHVSISYAVFCLKKKNT